MKNLFVLFCLMLLMSVSAFAQNDIRRVDFKNFTYQPDFCSGGEEEADQRDITVKDGEYYEETTIGEGEDAFVDRLYFNIFGITFGDLDGDKKDEAVILSVCNTGGTGNFTEAYIYKLVNGKPQRVMLLVGGDRADGGLRETRIENGLLIVDINNAGELGGACCPEFVITNTYKFDGKNLTEARPEQIRELYPAVRISFDRGKTSKTVRVKLNSEDGIKRFVVGASAGQFLTVTKDSAQASVILRKGDAEILQDDETLVAKLNETGDFIFELSISSEADLDFNMTVTIKNAER